MYVYTFRYLNGQSMPFQSINADDDTDFAWKVADWEQSTGFKHIPATVRCEEMLLTA